jgi:hypothetical protein
MDGRSRRSGFRSPDTLGGISKELPQSVSVQSPHYRARPLNGVWATAPYLHNGSVPSLYWMLKPAAERPKQFCMGARDFDPQHVGLHVTASCDRGETLFSMTASDGSTTATAFSATRLRERRAQINLESSDAC